MTVRDGVPGGKEAPDFPDEALGNPVSDQKDVLGGQDFLEEALGRSGGQPEEAPEGPHESDRTRQHAAIRIYSAARSIVLTLGAVLGVVSILVFAVSLVFGVRPLVVVSGSMEPTIPVGSVVFSAQTPAGDIQEGSIVTVERPRGLGLVTHRLIKSVEPSPGIYEYTLKGDANQQEDPEPYKVRTAGKYVWHVVGLGHLASFMQSSTGLVAAGAIGLAVLALFILDPARLRRDTTDKSGTPS